MPARILTLLLLALCAWPVQARTAIARIDQLSIAGVELDAVTVRLDWPAGAARGELAIEAARITAPGLGPEFRQVRWQCALAPVDDGGWVCAGPLRGRDGVRMQLAVDLSPARTEVLLARGDARLRLQRSAGSPDATQLELTRVPVLWAQAMLARAWPQGRLGEGTLDGTILVHAPQRQPLRVEGALGIDALALESEDASVAAAGLDGRIAFDYTQPGAAGVRVSVDGVLHDGEILVGSTYVALAATPVHYALEAQQVPAGGWSLPHMAWRDGRTLRVDADAVLAADGRVRRLALQASSDDLEPVPERYLSGWLGLAGLSGLALGGSASVDARIGDGALRTFDATLLDVDLVDPRGRLRIDGLAGELRHRASGAADGRLSWRSGALYGLGFGAIALPMGSRDGVLRLREPAVLSMLGGEARLQDLELQPAGAGTGLRLAFGLELDALDVGQLADALGWPAFRGTLGGRIPSARYADERLDFDGGLSMQVFGGRVDVAALSMERPFGVAPTLSADVSLHDLDLLGITGAFDVGSITGRLHGRIDGLRLVDWTATAFDAWLHTEAAPGVRQRISQRAVQDISSVGDASFVGSLQGRLIGLFDDFGYRRIGIGCRLSNEVCRMSGLHSVGNGFTIVEGVGVPKLQVVGFNRNVDWPTLVERLAAVAAGDVMPTVE